jgi:hypothetical protein
MGGIYGMTKRKSLALKTVNRIFVWFFLFLTLLSLFGIALMVFGLPGIFLFLNPYILFVVSVVFSCFSAIIFAILDFKRSRTED